MLPWELFDLPAPIPSAGKGECVCRNHSLPVDGFRYVSPACPVHYSRPVVSTFPNFAALDGLEEVFAHRRWLAARSALEVVSPTARKRITYPKMPVAKRQLLA
jgi:hypothetical protein